MEFINNTLSAMHLPGLNFLETVGAGAAMYFGVVIARFAIGFGQQMLARAAGYARQGSAVASGRRR